MKAIGLKAGRRVGQDAATAAGRDAGRLRPRRDQRAGQRAAAGRGLERAAGHGLHAPRADGQPPRLPAAGRPHHAPAPPQGGRHRRRLRRAGRAPHRARDHAALAARRRCLPAERPGHTAAAAPPPLAPPAGQADRQGRQLDRPRLGRSRAADRGDRQPVAAGGRVQAAARRAARVGGGRRPRRQPGRRADAGRADHRARSPRPASSSSSPAPPRTSTAGCACRRWATWRRRGRRRPRSRWPAGWSRPRRRGSRIAARVPGCCCWRWATSRIEAPDDRIVTWTWQLARAARDHEYRYAGSHVKDGRSLLGALAAASGEAAHTEAAAKLAAVATSSPLEAGAALLAVASPRRGTTAERLVERARHGAVRRLPAAGRRARLEHPGARAARQDARSARRRKEKERGDTISFNGAVVGSTPPAVSRPPQRRRRDRRGDAAGRRPAARRRRPAWSARSSASPRSCVWALSGDGDRRFATAPEVRCAAADQAPLEVQVAKLVSESSARADGPGLGRGRRAWWCSWAARRPRCCSTTPPARCSLS